MLSVKLDKWDSQFYLSAYNGCLSLVKFFSLVEGLAKQRLKVVSSWMYIFYKKIQDKTWFLGKNNYTIYIVCYIY